MSDKINRDDNNLPPPPKQYDDGSVEYVALKGTLYTPKKGDVAGAFCLCYNGATGVVVESLVWVIHSDKQPSVSLGENWETFNKNVRLMGAMNKDLTAKFTDAIPAAVSSSMRTYLYENPTDIAQAADALQKEFEKASHFFIDVSVAVEVFDEYRAIAGGIVRDPSTDKKSGGGSERSDENRTVARINDAMLECYPVIDPVHGRPISLLQPGDAIYVDVAPSSEIARQVINYLKRSGDESAFPVDKVEVLESGQKTVTVNINSDIRGGFSSTKDLRIKTYIETYSKYGSLSYERILQLMMIGGVLIIILLLINSIYFLVM